MKLLTRILSIATMATVGLYCLGCNGENTEPDPIEKIQLTKLSKTWIISSVMLDDNSRIADFTNFKLTLAGTFNESTPQGPYQYTVAGSRPSNNPWPPAGGIWSFGADPSEDLVRNDSPDLIMNYTVTNTQLTLIFNHNGTGFIGGRTSQVSGTWEFTFTK